MNLGIKIYTMSDLWDALEEERPLQIVGAFNAYAALLAERAGFKALYISGSGVATASLGLPDLGMTNLNDVLVDLWRLRGVTELPILVDIDTGWGNELVIERVIRDLERAGASGVHIEDQVSAKRCGHRPGKKVVPVEEMVARVRAAVAARRNKRFMVIARTDAYALEGLDGALRRAEEYVKAGADAIFPEGLKTLEEFEAFAKLGVPVLANITEFGKTPLFTREELAQAGVSMILYPLSAFRAASKAMAETYEAIRREGTQRGVLGRMHTREEIYEVIGYHEYEKRADELLKKLEGEDA